MNKVTKAEREKILARARELQRNGIEYAAAVAQIQAEFGISRERAKSAASKALRLSRYKRPTP
jgi:hypothetical protein